MGAARKELSDIAYDRDLHSRLERAADKLHELAGLRRDLEGAAAKATDAGAVEEARKAVAQAQSTIEKAGAARELADGALNTARRLDAAAHVRSGLKPGDACPVCGGVISSTVARDRTAHRGSRGGTATGAARGARRARGPGGGADEALARGGRRRGRDGRGRAAGEGRRGGVGSGRLLARRASRHWRPRYVAALGQLRALADRHRVVFDHEAGLRRQVDELTPRVASSQAELANLQGQAGALETEARQASEEAEASKSELIEIAGSIGAGRGAGPHRA